MAEHDARYGAEGAGGPVGSSAAHRFQREVTAISFDQASGGGVGRCRDAVRRPRREAADGRGAAAPARCPGEVLSASPAAA